MSKQAFNDRVIEMLIDFGLQLGKGLEVDRSARGLSFWLRESNLRSIENSFLALQSSELSLRRPVGRIFQIAPSNVDLLFLYTWALALLTGNSISTKLGSKVDEGSLKPVMEILDSVLLKYPEATRVTEFFWSDRQDPRIRKEIERCDLVIGWGSDATIKKLRLDAVQADKRFLGFPHRFSCALVNADFWAESGEREQSNFLLRFVSEIAAFDQGACTSPKSLIVVGRKDNRLRFTQSLSEEEVKTTSNNALGYLRFVNKVRLYHESEVFLPIPVEANQGIELLQGIEKVSQVSEERCVLGMVPLIELDSIDALASVIDRPLQTLSVWGYEPIWVSNVLADNGIHPLRTVRIGSTHNFDTVWDGTNLLAGFTWPQRT